MAPFLLSIFIVLASTIPQGSYAVNYNFTNTAESTPGGKRFDSEMGAVYSRNTLYNATNFIWSLFEETTKADRKMVTQVGMFLDNMTGVAYTEDDEIHVSAIYINEYSGDLKTEITGVLFHESAHVWQWAGNESTPGGLIEGVADFVRLKAGLAPSHWVKPGEGDSWDKGYDVTALFLNYCDGLKKGFVAQLNKLLREGYSDEFFVRLLGKTPDKLFIDYKNHYNTTRMW